MQRPLADIGPTTTNHAAYLDAVFQYTWYDATADSLRFPALEGNATGLAASLEAGKPFHFTKDSGWLLEPQLQGIYQHFDRTDSGDVAGFVTSTTPTRSSAALA